MSGSANNLPVRVQLEGVEDFNRQIRQLAEEVRKPAQAAEQLAPAFSRAGEAFGRLEGRTQALGRSVRDLRGAMDLIGASGVGGSLGAVASTLGNVADAFGTAGTVAGRLTGGLSALTSVIGPLGVALGIVGGAAATLGIAYEAVAKRNEEARLAQETYSTAIRTSNELLGRYVQTAEEAFNVKKQESEQTLRNAEALERETLARSNEAASRVAAVRARLEEARAAGRASPEQVASGIARADAAAGGVIAIQEGITIRLATIARQLADLENLRFNPGGGSRGGSAGSGSGPVPRDRSLTVSLSEDIYRQDQAAERAEQQARERREREEEQTLRRIEQANERTTDNIVRYAGDAFADLFANTGGGWEAMMARFRQTAIQTFARIAAEAVIRPIIAPIVSGMNLGGVGGGGAGGGGFGDILGLGGQLSSLSGLGGSFSSALAAPIMGTEALGAATNAALGGMGGAYGPATLGQVSASSSWGSLTGVGATSWGAALGSVAGGFALGTMVGGFTAGNSPSRRTNSMVGSAAGTALGFIVGGPVGALVGGAIGGGAGGLIGPSPNPAMHIAVGGREDGRLGIINSGQKHLGEEFAALAQQSEQEIRAVNALLAGAGVRVSGTTQFGRDGADPNRPATLNDAIGSLDFTSDNANLNTALRTRRPGSLEDLTGTVQFVTQVYDVLLKAGEPADAFAEQLKAINAQFDAATARARELGLSEEKLGEARARALAAAEAARSDAAAGQLLGPVSGLAGFVSSLRTSSDSPLNPFARRLAAREQFEASLRSAYAGDASAFAAVQSNAQAFLAASREVGGSGTGYVQDFQETLGRLDTLLGRPVDALTAQVFQAETRSQTQILSELLSRAVAEIAALRTSVEQGGRMPARLAA
jgi:hypothetical protein